MTRASNTFVVFLGIVLLVKYVSDLLSLLMYDLEQEVTIFELSRVQLIPHLLRCATEKWHILAATKQRATGHGA